MPRSSDPQMPTPPNQIGTTRLPDGRDMGWAEFGDPEGDAVFWFHGTPGARSQIPHDLHDHAIERRLRVIGVERPGTGHSSPHRYERVVDFTPDLEAVADDLSVERFAAVGLSGGGPFVLATAARLPDRFTAGVVLGGIGPTRGPDAVISHTLLLVPLNRALGALRDLVGDGIGSVIRTFGHVGEPLIDAFFWLEWGDREAMAAKPETKTQMLGDLIDAARRGTLGSPLHDLVLFGRDWGFELRDVRAPITFWGGTSDVIVPYVHAERQSKRVAGSRLRTEEGRGHFAGYTSVDQIFTTIRESWPVVRAVAI